MAMNFTAIDPEVARQELSKKQRTSKHRETLQSFWDANIAAAQLELEADEDGKEPNKGSVASGLGNALRAAKENKLEWADKIIVRNKANGVFLVNTTLMPDDAEAEADEVSEDAEEVERETVNA